MLACLRARNLVGLKCMCTCVQAFVRELIAALFVEVGRSGVRVK
jgi:hypothetical protein